jgi:hypothetical protein
MYLILSPSLSLSLPCLHHTCEIDVQRWNRYCYMNGMYAFARDSACFYLYLSIIRWRMVVLEIRTEMI